MMPSRSDAFVFFGATGDLAYKKVFPALASLVRRGHLDAASIGVANQGWQLPQLVERARASLREYGVEHEPFDEAVVDKLCARLRYVDGDYMDAGTFASLRRELGAAAHPL